MGVAFGGTILANLLGVILLAVLMVQLGAESWLDGLVLGAIIGLVYRAGAHALHNGFAMRSPKRHRCSTACTTSSPSRSPARCLGLF